MLSNKTQTEKSETFLLAHALLLLVLSLLVGVQGIFEIIDYMPHIISAGCINCGAYAASIPSTLVGMRLQSGKMFRMKVTIEESDSRE